MMAWKVDDVDPKLGWACSESYHIRGNCVYYLIGTGHLACLVMHVLFLNFTIKIQQFKNKNIRHHQVLEKRHILLVRLLLFVGRALLLILVVSIINSRSACAGICTNCDVQINLISIEQYDISTNYSVSFTTIIIQWYLNLI